MLNSENLVYVSIVPLVLLLVLEGVMELELVSVEKQATLWLEREGEREGGRESVCVFQQRVRRDIRLYQ